MRMGIVGRKVGMTRVFEKDGTHIPVTVIEAGLNRITQCKTPEKDGYSAIQITYGEQKASRINKAQKGHLAKSGSEPGRGSCEFRVDDVEKFLEAKSIDLSIFQDVNFVDVTGVSKGKGFQGGVKRHNFHMQDATHGNSLSHRVIGSTGQNQTPGKVFKGKKMPGQMGNVTTTVMSQKLVRVDEERNLILVRGTVPGSNGKFVVVRPAVKKS